MIGIALLGAGRIGAMHARHIAAHPRARLSAVYDAEGSAAAAVAAQCGAPAADRAAPALDAADAVLIASPTATHCDYIELAAAAGKPALCEKPPGLDIARVEQCRQKLAALGGDAIVQLGFNRRFDPGHAELAARAASGELGRLEKLIITSRDPAPPPADYWAVSGGLFRDMMIHDFDLARFVLGEEPAQVFAAGGALVAPDICARCDDVDTAMVILRAASGALCHINCSRRAAYGYDQRVEAFGAHGMLISDNRAATAVTRHGADGARRGPLPHFFIERYAESYRRQLDAFVAAVENRRPAAPSFEDGRRALLLANAAEKALRRGQWAEVEF